MGNHLFYRQNQFAFWKTAINRLDGNYLFLNESNYLNVNEWQIEEMVKHETIQHKRREVIKEYKNCIS